MAAARARRRNFGAPVGPGGPDQFKQGNRDNFYEGGGGPGKKKTFGEPGGPGGPNQFKQGNRDQDEQGGGGQRKQKLSRRRTRGLEDQRPSAASSNSTRAADRPEAIKVVVVAAATRSARSTPKSRSARGATSLRLGTRQRRLGKANQPTIFIKDLAGVSELGQHLGQLFVDFANEPR